MGYEFLDECYAVIRGENVDFKKSKQNVSKIEKNARKLQIYFRFCENSEKSDLKTSKITVFSKHPLVFIGVGMEIGAILRLIFADDIRNIVGLCGAVFVGVCCIIAGCILGRYKGMGNKSNAAKCHKAERCKYGNNCPRRYSPLSDWFACFERNKINSAMAYKGSGKKKGGK